MNAQVVCFSFHSMFSCRVHIYNILYDDRNQNYNPLRGSEFKPETDGEYMDMGTDGYSLLVPGHWVHKTFRLSFMVENYASNFNILATDLFSTLYAPTV